MILFTFNELTKDSLMEIDDLRTVIAVIEGGGVAKGATILNRVPSGVTTRLLKLEESLGNKLFIREKKKLIPTPAGRELYERAKTIIRLIKEAEMQARGDKAGGIFKIGAMESALAGKLIEPLALFHAAYKEVDLEIEIGRSFQLQKLLKDNKLDAIFVAVMVPDIDEFEMVKVFDDELMIITPPTHTPVHEPKDLSQTTLLVLSDGCSYTERFLHWFAINGERPKRIVTMASCHAILVAVAAGMGVGIMPVSFLDNFPQKDAISIYSMPDMLGRVEVKMVWKKNMMSANIMALKQFVDCSL